MLTQFGSIQISKSTHAKRDIQIICRNKNVTIPKHWETRNDSVILKKKYKEQTAHKIFVLFWKFLAIFIVDICNKLLAAWWIIFYGDLHMLCSIFVYFIHCILNRSFMNYFFADITLPTTYHLLMWKQNIEWINKCEPAQYRIQNKFMDEKIYKIYV